MSAEAYPRAKHGVEAFARMLRVLQHDTHFLSFHISDDVSFEHKKLPK